MRVTRSCKLAIVLGFAGMTASAALAGPIVIGPPVAPVTLSATTTAAVPARAAVRAIKVKVLQSYRQLRAFWLSRGLIR